MGGTRRAGGLEGNFGLGQERAEWKAQRAGWSVMLAILLGALAGLFGSGPLSRAAAGDARLRVEYARFARYQSPAELRITCVAPRGGRLRISIDRSFLEQVEVQDILPAPVEEGSAGETYYYLFAVGAEAGQHTITIRYQPNHYGTVSGRIATSEVSVRIKQFYWP